MTFYEVVDSVTLDGQIIVKVFEGDECIINKRYEDMTEEEWFMYREYEVKYLYAQPNNSSDNGAEIVFELEAE